MYMKRTINLTLESNIYHSIKNQIPSGKISPIVNDLLKEYLRKQEQEQLKVSYQDFAKNKKVKEELAVWQEAVGDGINDDE